MTDPFAHLPHNRAAENNKKHIFKQLQRLDLSQSRVLEVGSGTGQQGIYCCQQSPQLVWQATEQASNMATLEAWHCAAQSVGVDNFLLPQVFAIGQEAWPKGDFDLIYCSNVLHIVDKVLAQTLVQQVAQALEPGQRFICYGPFKRNGAFTTESNAEFHQWLLQQGYGGVNDMDDIVSWSDKVLQIEQAIDMPANNFLVVYTK